VMLKMVAGGSRRRRSVKKILIYHSDPDLPGEKEKIPFGRFSKIREGLARRLAKLKLNQNNRGNPWGVQVEILRQGLTGSVNRTSLLKKVFSITQILRMEHPKYAI